MRRLTSLRFPDVTVEHLLLLLIVIAALALRLNGLNWDSGYGFHPDERSLYMRAGCMYDLLTESPGFENCLTDHPSIEPGIPGWRTLLDFDRSPLNPNWFPLGSVLIYTLVICRYVIELFTDVGALDMRYVGRTLSALADVGSVVMVYVLGRRIYGQRYGPWVGLLAAALVAFAVIHVQNSHFFRPETFSAFWILAVFWAILRVIEKRRLRDSLLLGLLTGMAFAPKVSILPILLPLALCYYYRLVDTSGGRWSGVSRGAVEQTELHALAGMAVALAAFFLVTPYGLLYLSNFLAEQAAQANMANNAGLWPFTIQYVGTPAFFYQFKQVGVWGLGPLLGVAAWASLVFSAFLVWQGTFARRADILILAWLIPSIIMLEAFEVRFQRYYFALVPFMVLLGSRMLLWAPFYLEIRLDGEGVRRRAGWSVMGRVSWLADPLGIWSYLRYNRRGKRYLLVGCWSLVGIVLATTVFYALAFQQVYLKPHPAIAASEWINANLPPGTAIVSDNHWDEFVPELYGYQVWQFPAYEPDNVGKMAELGDRLANAEYLVFYSQRPYVSVASDPERFPFTLEYYRQLFGGELGYRLERTFNSHPSFLGITIKDSSIGRTGLPQPEPAIAQPSPGLTFDWGYADDNVVGYDHPTAMLFRNVERLPAETVVASLAKVSPSATTGLKFSAEDWERQQAGGTWSELFNRDGIANRLPALAWLLVVELIYLAALPVAMFLFRPLADRGMVLARVFGLLAVAYITWLIVSLGLVEFSTGAILVGLLMVAALSAVVLARFRREFVEFIRLRWRVLVTGEAIFLAAFLAFAVIRALNPDLWHPYRGGEKPMELAYFNAVIRSSLLPPYDPWFAGGYLNYYYWGYFILAIPTRLAGVVPTVAFNLAVPLLFALTVTGAYSLVYNLAEGYRRSRRPVPPPRLTGSVPSLDSDSDYAGDYRYNTVRQFTRTESVIRSPITAGLTAALFVAVIGNLDGMVQLAQGIWGKFGGAGADMPPFDFWRSSRMLPNLDHVEPGLLTFWLWGAGDSHPEVSWHITEFPFFSFLFADLHAHMMAIPFTILVIALGLSFVVGFGRLGRVWNLAATLALSVALGSLWLINSWDYPSFVLLTLALVALVACRVWPEAKARLTGAAILAVVVTGISVLAFLPFHQAVETFGTGIEVTRWKTPLANFVGIHGLFLVIIGAFLVWQSRRALYLIAGGNLRLGFLDVGMETDNYRRAFQKGLRIYFVAGLAVIIYFALAGYLTVAVLLAYLTFAGLAAWDLMTARERGEEFTLFPLLLSGLALGLVIGVDLVRVEDDIGRMNTQFKYYLEAWTLLALASAYFLWRTWYDYRFRPYPLDWARLIWLGVVALLILVSLIYPVLGTKARVADRFNPLPATLDGTAFMRDAVHWEKEQSIELKHDLEAIQWLQDNVAGSPVILEAHTEQYRWGGRMANYTGLPTVLGWPWHQIQQRGTYSAEVGERARDVHQIYTTDDLELAARLLEKYNVKYVVVGDLERVFYSGDGTGKFDIIAQQGAAAKVFDNGQTAIYRLAGR